MSNLSAKKFLQADTISLVSIVMFGKSYVLVHLKHGNKNGFYFF